MTNPTCKDLCLLLYPLMQPTRFKYLDEKGFKKCQICDFIIPIQNDIEEKQEQYDKLIEESKKILGLTQREYDNTVHNAEIKLIKSKKDIILEAGRYLENNLEIVKNNSPNYICRMLKENFKGMINPTRIWFYSPETWKSKGRADLGRIGGLKKQELARKILANSDVKPLTEYESQYVEVHDQKVYHNGHIVALIDDFLGMNESEKTVIFTKLTKSLLEKLFIQNI